MISKAKSKETELGPSSDSEYNSNLSTVSDEVLVKDAEINATGAFTCQPEMREHQNSHPAF